MIELSRPIQAELSGLTYSLNPLIVIEGEEPFYTSETNTLDAGGYDNSIFLSSVKQTFDVILQTSPGQTIQKQALWEDRNLKIGHIKESIDISNKNFKINNVSISLSNEIVNGVRFSDVVADKNILHKNVNIYYQTPSCKTIQDCLLVYRGVIVKLEHDFKIFKFECEDKTQHKLNKKIPIASLGFGTHIVNDDDKNKTIPITYGTHERAPAVLVRQESNITDEDFSTYVLCDDVKSDSRDINMGGFNGEIADASAFLGGQNNACPLFIFKGEYYQVTQELTNHILSPEFDEVQDFGSWEDPTQYTIVEDNYLKIPTSYGTGLFPKTPAAFGDLQAFIIRHPKDVIVAPTDPLATDGIWTNITETHGVTIASKQNILDTTALIGSTFSTLDFDAEDTLNTFATVPDNTVDIFAGDGDWVLRTDYSPGRWNNNRHLGMWLPKWNDNIQLETDWGYITTDNLTTGQFMIAQYLFLYAAEINTGWTPSLGTEPPIEIITMPCKAEVLGKVRERIIKDFYYKDDQGTPFEEEDVVFPNNIPDTIYYLATSDGVNTQNAGTYQSINSNVITGEGWLPETDWMSAYTGDNVVYYPFDYPNTMANHVNAYPMISANAFEDYISEGAAHIVELPINADSATELFSIDHRMKWAYAAGEGGHAHNPMYPQGVFYRFQISQQHWEYVFSTGTPNNFYNNMANLFVTVSQTHESWADVTEASKESIGYMGTDSDGSTTWGSALIGGNLEHYDFFEDGEYPNLFEKNSRPRHVPIDRTGLRRFDHEEHGSTGETELYRNMWGANLQYTTYHNSIASGDMYLNSQEPIWKDQAYFTRWGQGSFIGAATEDAFTDDDFGEPYQNHYLYMEENYGWEWDLQELQSVSMFAGGTGSQLSKTCSCFMINESFFPQVETNFSSWLEDFQVSGEFRYEQLKIPKNTLIPLFHFGNSLSERISYGDYPGSTFTSWWSAGAWLHWMSDGNLYDTDLEYVTVSTDLDESPPSQRMALIFPVDPIEVEDDILTKTVFFGKLSAFVSEGSPAGGAQKFRVALNKIEYNDNSVNIEIFHEDMEFRHDRLISRSISGAPGIEASFSTNDEDDGEFINNQWEFENVEWIQDVSDETYSGFDVSSAGWNEVNSYNAFCLQYYMYDNNQNAASSATFNTKLYKAGIINFVHFNPSFNSPFFADINGRVNNTEDVTTTDAGLIEFKYIGGGTGSESGESGAVARMIEKPGDIMYHLIEKEFDLVDLMNYSSLQKARTLHLSDKYAFSIDEEITGKEFLKQFSGSTKLFPTFKSTSKFGFAMIKNTYSQSDVDLIIKSKEIIKYNFIRTGIGDVSTLVNIKYKFDHAKSEYSRETGWVDGYDMFGNGDGIDGAGLNAAGRPNGYRYTQLGIEREDNIIEFESKYIRDQETAVRMRDYIYLNSCNQHNVFKIQLPLKYIILEVGDIIKFDSLINNMKAYGEDYTTENTRNGQLIYPYFIVTSVSRRSKNVDIECYQLHKLEKTYQPLMGSVTRLVDTNDNEIYLTLTDSMMIQDFVDGNDRYFTSGQKLSSDFNQDGIVDEADLYTAEVMEFAPMVGDLNADGEVNIVDIVMMLNYIISAGEVNDFDFALGDINEDGIINVVDIVALVNYILAGGD